LDDRFSKIPRDKFDPATVCCNACHNEKIAWITPLFVEGESMVKKLTQPHDYHVQATVERGANIFGGWAKNMHMLRGISPAMAKTLAVVLVILIFALDYYTPADINPAGFYACVIIVLAWTRSDRWLWGGTALVVLLTMFGLTAGSGPASHAQIDWVDWTNRYITAFMLIVTAGIVRIGVHLSQQVETGERLLAEVAARERAEDALRHLQADFAHAARISMLGELTASIAHELRQPLASIAANGTAGGRWLDRETPDIEEAQCSFSRIEAEAQRCVDIIGRIRGMALRREPENTLASLDELIDEALLFLRSDVKAHEITVSHVRASGVPGVIADRIQLQQVIVNLVLNAIQATERAGRAERKITIRTAAADAATVCCSVEDSGPGIAPEHFTSIFKSFFTTRENGMGMGLSICRSIVEAHGGRITADNASVHGGARLSFTLPTAGSAA
jgi:signal transduction histidine kinase